MNKNQNRKEQLFSFIKFLIGWPISAVAIFFIGKIILSQFNLVKPYIKIPELFPFIAGVVCFILFYFGRAFVFKKLLEEKGHSIEFKEDSFLWQVSCSLFFRSNLFCLMFFLYILIQFSQFPL